MSSLSSRRPHLKLTGSFTAAARLGGAIHAMMHPAEGWSNFADPTDRALSLIVAPTYQGPGLFKTFVTSRTGNARVHAIANHAIAPPVMVDALSSPRCSPSAVAVVKVRSWAIRQSRWSTLGGP